MQMLLFALFVLSLGGFFLQNKRSFVKAVLVLGAFPLIFLMPTLIIPISGSINIAGAFLLMLFVLSLISAISNFHILIKIIKKFYLLAIFILFSLVTLIWTFSVGNCFSMTIKYVMPILFITLILSVMKSPKDILKYEKSIIICACILIFLGVFNKITGGYFDSAEGKMKWAGTMVLLAPYMSPANYSFMLGMAALLSFSNYIFTKKKIWLFLYLLFFVAVLLAFTRISMAAVLLSSLILYGITKRSILITFIAPGIAFITSISAIVFIKPLRDRMFFDGKSIDFSLAFSDFRQFLTHVDTSGRTALWQGALDYYKNGSVMFGSGSGSTDYWVSNFSKAGAIHSEFLRIYLDLGAMGLILFLFSLFQLIGSACGSTRNKKNGVIHQKYKALCIASSIFYFTTLFTDNTLNYVTGFGIYFYSFIAFSMFFVFNKNDYSDYGRK